MCLAALLYEQFLPIREWRCQDIDQVLLHGDHFFLSSELLDKNASTRSKLPTAACWSREITEENLKQTCFMSKAKATSVPQLGNHSQYSSGRYISLTPSPWTTTMDYRNGLPKWTAKRTTEMDYLNGLLNGLPKWTTLNGNRSFRLLSVRLRIMSVRLRLICQFAYDSYVSFKTELFKSPCRTSQKKTVTAS